MSNYFEIEASLQNALQYKRQHPSASFRWLERQFHVKKDRIYRRWKGIQVLRMPLQLTTWLATRLAKQLIADKATEDTGSMRLANT